MRIRWWPALLLSIMVPRLAAQDLEPTLDRAARTVAVALSHHLPGRTPPPESLRLLPRGGGDEAGRTAALQALKNEGFLVFDGPGGPASSGLELQAWSEPASPWRRLVLETVERAPVRFTCLFGDAPWVDAAPEKGLVIEGSWARSAALALEDARGRAERQILRQAGWRDGEASVPEALRRPLRGHRSFVGSAGEEGGRLFRAWIQVLDPEDQVAGLRRALGRAERRQALAPWLRLAGSAVLAVGLGLLYLRTDLRTRGYLTGRLRLLFGILFLVGAGLLWRIPL